VAGNRYVQVLDLSPGFGDCGDGHDAFACLGVGSNRMIGRVLWGGCKMKTIGDD